MNPHILTPCPTPDTNGETLSWWTGNFVKLRLIGGSGCGNGPCPAVYETENKTIVVQGFAVEIPRYILEQALITE